MVVWLAQPIPLQVLVRIEPGRYRAAEPLEQGRAVAALPDERAYQLGLFFVAHDEEVSAGVLCRLRRRRARFFVVGLAVDDRREPVLRVALHVLPDVEDRSAGRVHERAALRREQRHVADGHAERRQNHDVVDAERGGVFARIRQKANALGPQPRVDVRVVDDFAREKYVLMRKALAGFIRVVHRAVDSVIKTELAREMDCEAAACR